ncbi:MAG TPA: ABC transporter permease [Gaiellaceae bacterium]|nr:ABC transporter permease [Gaiellaceae bacterium]
MRNVALLLRKDARVLARSRALVAVCVVYPLVLALLVGLVVRYAGERPRVALVDNDELPRELVVGGQRFNVAEVIEDVEGQSELVPLSEDEADRELEAGRVVAVVVVPPGFAERLRTMAESPKLVLKTARGGLAARVEQQIQALVYNLNRRLQDAYIEANLRYVQILREGGSATARGNEFDVIGLEEAGRILAEIERTTDDPAVAARARELGQFVREARVALALSDDSLRATANPIELETDAEGGRWPLSAQVQGTALGVALAFLCVLVAAAGIAAEREENTIARLARGLVRLGELVAEKVALVAAIAVALGLAVAVAFAVAVELAGAPGAAAWERLPLLALALALAGAALGAVGVLVGVLARETRTASLVGVLVALPFVLLGLVPEGAVDAAGALSQAFPFAHTVRITDAALYEGDPWRPLAREAGWLLALTAAYALAARAGMRRLLG